MTEHDIFFFLPMPSFFFLLLLLSLYIFMDLSASPSICQSIHLPGNICHFSCHLNHPSIRPSVFQATLSSSLLHSSVHPDYCALGCCCDFLLLKYGDRFEEETSQMAARSRVFTQTGANTPVCPATHKAIKNETSIPGSNAYHPPPCVPSFY